MSAASHPTIPAPVQKPEVVAPRPAPVKPKSGKPWKWLLVLAIIAIGGYALYSMRTAKQAADSRAAAFAATRTTKVATGTLQRTIRLAGQTAAVDFANITAPMMRGREANSEMVLIQLAKSGAWVKKGQLVAQIDAQSLQDHIDDLGDTIETAQSDVYKRKAEQSIEWENLQQSLRVAKSEADKAKLDYSAAEVRTDVERQLLKLTLDETEAQYKQLQGDLKQKQIAHAADLRLLELTLERHTRHRDRHKRDHQAFSIYAPMDGLVVMSQIFRGGEFAQVQQGDQLRPGQGFMKIVNTNKMHVEGAINQSESSEIRIGQKAQIKLDAFAGMEFPGEVHSIGALASAFRQGYWVRTVPIRVRINGSDPRLIPDLSASVDINVEQSDNGIVAPLTAVHTEGGETFAYIKKGDAFERREIEVGLKNGTHAIIRSGLQQGDEVRVN